jgi:hypothetical protein
MHCTLHAANLHHASGARMLIAGDEIRGIAQESAHDIVHDIIKDQYTWRRPRRHAIFQTILGMAAGWLG